MTPAVVGRLQKGENNPDSCDVAFNDDMMSRRHFEVLHSDGIYPLRDLDSRNGTFVNGEPSRIRDGRAQSWRHHFRRSIDVLFHWRLKTSAAALCHFLQSDKTGKLDAE